MAEWSVVAARDRKQCEEVPAEWRPEAWMQDCACRGLSWARHRTGQARYAAVGTQSGVEAACIETFLLLLFLLKPFFLARARALARLFSVRNELWSRGGPIGCSTPLCTTGPVQTGLSPGPAVRLKPNEAKEPVYTIGVWTRKTARQPGREQQGEACSMETYIRVLVSRGNGRRMIRVSRYLVGSTGRRGREMGGMDESLFLIDLFSSRLRIYYISFHYYWKIVKNLDDIDNQFFLRRKKLNWEEQTKLEVNLEEERYKFVRITR